MNRNSSTEGVRERLLCLRAVRCDRQRGDPHFLIDLSALPLQDAHVSHQRLAVAALQRPGERLRSKTVTGPADVLAGLLRADVWAVRWSSPPCHTRATQQTMRRCPGRALTCRQVSLWQMLLTVPSIKLSTIPFAVSLGRPASTRFCDA